MKAVQCHAFGPVDQLTVDQVPGPQPTGRQVLIDVRAAAVNFPEVLLVKGLYQNRPDFPFIPGAEAAGVVSALGPEVRDLKVGDQVATQMRVGAYAEKILADERLCHVFSQASFEAAASFLVTYGTSYHALKDRARLQPGETISVLGAAGGVGLAAVELAKKMGATVIACASTQEKLDLCKSYGADHLVNYRETPLREALGQILGKRGPDVMLDPVGGDYAELGVRSMAFGGRYLVVGFTAGNIPKIPLNLPLLKGCSLVGVFWGRFLMEDPTTARANHDELMAWIDAGELRPHIQRSFALEEAVQALQWVESRKVMGKVVLIPSSVSH